MPNEYSEAEKIAEIVDKSQHIVIVQADNPDIDSLASSLALESILENLGKTVHLYCGVDLPSYMHYLPGWGRVSNDMPKNFDLSIIVDTASDILLEQLNRSGAKSWLASKDSIVIDHHPTDATISFAKVILNPKASSTGEIIYELCVQMKWEMDKLARELLAAAILSDSLGLMTSDTSARTIHIIAELVENGVNLPELESARRESLKRDPSLIHYKGRLLERVEFHNDNRIATLTVPWEEIEKYSPLYNPAMLVIDDMRLAIGTDVAIVFKLYKEGKITAKIRSNYGRPISDKLAEEFGGGGHPYASGFKIQDGSSLDDVKAKTLKLASELLQQSESELKNEVI